MGIELLALDMDDTLLTEDLRISPENKEALKKAEEKGVIIVLASGRSPFAMEKYAKELGMDKRKGYKICYNGASIIRTDTGEEVYAHRLPTSFAKEVYKVVNELGYPIQTYKGDTIYVSFKNEYTDLDCKLTGMGQEVVKDFINFLEEEPVKFVIPGEVGQLIQLEEMLKKKFGNEGNIFRSKPYFLEVMPKGADKGNALAHLAEIMQVSRENIMAVGDAMNDAGMIQYAGTGVAMCNAIEEVKKMADVITEKSHNESGIAEIVKKYIL